MREWTIVSQNEGKKGTIPKLWDGKTAERIGIEVIKYLENH